MAPPSTAPDVDGRRLRRAQNRETVLDALVELFEAGNYQPSAVEIAERAGVSPRSLFRYFDDVDDLRQAAVERHLATARPLFESTIDAGAPTAAKVRELVRARAELWEAVAPAARAARIGAHRHHLLAERLADTRAHLRAQVRHLFATELSGDRALLLPAVDALCEFETYELLRHDQGLSRARAEAALTAAVSALLASPVEEAA